MAEPEHAGVSRPFAASASHECKQRAEDDSRPDVERLVWAVLAVAAELHIVRKHLRKG